MTPGLLQFATSDLLERPEVRKGIYIALIWILVGLLTKLNRSFFDRIDRRLSRYNVPERRLAKLDFLTDIFLVLLGVFVTLHILGVSQALWGAVAITGIAGVIVALAAQRLGENILAGIVILLERPFIVGDTIEVDGQTGKAEKVTLHSTTLETPDGLRAVVPNSRVANSSLTNYTANPYRRVVARVDVVEAVDLDRVRATIREAVASDAHLVEERPIRVFATDSLDEGVRFEARYWVTRAHYMDHCLPSSMERILDALNESGLATAMPAQRVYVQDAEGSSS